MTSLGFDEALLGNLITTHLDASARATVASLVSLVWSFGRSFSPTISGYLQVEYGCGTPFAIEISLYAVAVFLYWMFFVRHQRRVVAESIPGVMRIGGKST